MRINIFHIVLTFIPVLVSCKKSEPELDLNFGYNYFPLKIGQSKTFEIDSTIYNGFNDAYTLHYLVTETVVDTFSSGDRINYVLERKSYLDNQLKSSFRFYQSKGLDRVEEVVQNERIVILTFPVTLNATWNGNAFNQEDEEDFQVIDISQDVSLGELTFDSVCTVLQYEDTSNFVVKQLHQEKFATNVGLISRTHLYLMKRTGSADRKDTGVYVQEKLVKIME